MKPVLYIIGGESTAVEIRETAELFYSSSYSRIVNVVKDGAIRVSDDYIYDSEFKNILEKNENAEYIISFIDFNLRQVFIELLERFLGMREATIIHRNAYVSNSAQIGKGTYIAANAVVSSNARVGMRCIVNYQSVIGHDVVVGDDCIINPGAKLSGSVQLGNRVLIGANSMLYEDVVIGDNVMVDAMSYVRRNVSSNQICSSCLDVSLRIYKNRLYKH